MTFFFKRNLGLVSLAVVTSFFYASHVYAMDEDPTVKVAPEQVVRTNKVVPERLVPVVRNNKVVPKRPVRANVLKRKPFRAPQRVVRANAPKREAVIAKVDPVHMNPIRKVKGEVQFRLGCAHYSAQNYPEA